MRIAFVYSGYSQRTTSGIWVQVNLMMDFLKKRGYQVYFYPLREIKWLPGFLLVFLRIIKPTLGRRFKEWLKEINPEVVVIQGIYLPESRFFAYSKQKKWKLILIQYGFPDLPLINIFVLIYLMVIGKAILKKADRVIVISHYTYQKISSYIDKSKISIIFPGINLEKFYPFNYNKRKEIRKSLKITYPIILGVGRFIFLKNFRVLIKALKFVPKAQLFLVGGGFPGRKLKKLANSLGIENRVKFFSYLPFQQLLEFYNIADITVLPSLAEGLGLVLIESLACGTPIIGTRLGGIKEIIEDGKNGFFLENPYDERELAMKINKLLEDKKLRNKMALYGIKLVRERFDKDKLLVQFEEVIKSTVFNLNHYV